MTSEKVLALIGAGGDFDRALAVAAAEAGADLALGTVSRDEVQEFAINSIANEAWTIGREQFAVVLDSLDASAVSAFAEETWDRYGRCDVLVCRHEAISEVELDELSRAEFAAALRDNLVAPFIAAQAFGRLMEREGRGAIVFVCALAPAADAATEAARAGLNAVAEAITGERGESGVKAVVAEGTQDAVKDRVLRLLES